MRAQTLYEDNTKGAFRESWITRLLHIDTTLIILVLYLLCVLVSAQPRPGPAWPGLARNALQAHLQRKCS